MAAVAYNEYKFHVSNEKLSYLRDVLDSLYGNTDPFPSGYVDSIYYDTYKRHFYNQCLNGEPRKVKFRIRGYGDGKFVQLHRKEKDIFGVGKLKNKIKPVSILGNMSPEWNDILPVVRDDATYTKIQAFAVHHGHLIPVIRVKYFRYRYRVNDYRITLDTKIEVMGFSNGVDNRLDHAVIPYHVLEVKTIDPRPHLPFLGLAQLPQISFSKFFLGLNLLANGSL